MTRCPDDAALEQLIADTLPDDEQRAFDEHLSGCARCQQRIDDLAGVSGFTGVAVGAAESTNLRRAILCLQAAPYGGDTPTGASVVGRRPLPELLPAERPGFIGRLGDIHIRRLIGRGGMGVVYEGLDPALDRTVAVKVLSPHLVGDGEANGRFLREAQAAAALSHDAVVTIHAVGEADGVQYLVLQYVPGESLADRLDRETMLPLDEVVRLGAQVARGLAAAHSRGLVHRDIKPANILLDDETGAARIADFGLARRDGFDTLTDVGVAAGTPAYMSPEQSINSAVDARSDLFSLGVVLYHSSTGRLPFAADSPLVILNQVRTTEPPPLREINSALPEWFCALVDRLLEKDPDRRAISAAEVAECLEKHTARLPAPPNWASRFAFAALALVAVAGVALSAYLVFREKVVPPAPTSGFLVAGASDPYPSLAEAVEAAPDGGVIEVYGDGPYTSPAIKIDGKRLTIRAAPGARPRFIPDRVGEGGPLQFLFSNTDLCLEGLDIHWPNPSPQNIALDFAGARGVVGTTDGRFQVSNCRVACGRIAACVWSGAKDFVVTNCHLIAPSGTCLAWRPQPSAGKSRVEQNQFEGQTAVMVVPFDQSAPESPTLTLLNNTIVSDRTAIRFLLESAPRVPVGFTLHRNIIDSPVMVTLVGLRNFPHNLTTHETMAETLRDTVAWSEAANVYRKDTVYLAGTKPRQPASSVPSDIRSLEQWFAYWNQSAGASIEATIRFHPRASRADTKPLRLAGIDAFAGTVPDAVGADESRVAAAPGR